MKNLKTLQVLKNLFYGLILVASASVIVVSANSQEISPIVDTPDLPVCDIQTLENS